MQSTTATAMVSLRTSLLLIFVVLLIASSSSSSRSTASTPTRHLRKKAVTATSSSSTSTSSTTSKTVEESRQLIVGGKDATHNQYPKSIVYLSDREDGLSCGGTLISPTIVLAAGHCEISLVTDAVFLRYYHPENENEDRENEIQIAVKSEIKHPEFNLRTLENDVMLLILEESPNDVQDDSVVPYMKLHTPSDPSLDELVELMSGNNNKGILDQKGDGNGRFGNTAKINYNSISSNQENESKARKIGDKLRSPQHDESDNDEEEDIETTTNETTFTTNNNESNTKARQIGDKLRLDENSGEEDAETKSTSSVNPKHTALKLKALGWGHTTDSGNNDNNPLQRSEAAELLQEATLHYVLDEECNQARDESESSSVNASEILSESTSASVSSNVLTYEGRIQADMMCTWQSKQDTCHGDSGGPIYLEAQAHPSSGGTAPNNERDHYVQVGIVSWGEDCADDIFPGVASRVSMSYDWIRRRVCSIDGAHPGTPTSFDCASLLSPQLDDNENESDASPSSSSSTFSPAPSSSPSTKMDKVDAEVRSDAMELLDGTVKSSSSRSSEHTVPVMLDVTVEIHLDVFAVEQAWKLVDEETGIAIRDYPFGTYQYENYIKEEHIQLEVGRIYKFTIYDQYGDGITNNGYYQIYYNGEKEVDLVPATEFTGQEQEHQFTIPSLSTSTSTSTTTTTIPIPSLSSSLPSSSSMAAFALVSSPQTVASTSQGRNGGSPTERLRKKGNPKDRSPP